MKKEELKSFIQESVNNYVSLLKESMLDEWDRDDPDEGPEDFYDRPEVKSSATFYFDPQTFEIIAYEDADEEEHAWISVSSKDFPRAWIKSDNGDYWTPPSWDGECGECGGHYKIDESGVPEEFEDNYEAIIKKFCQLHKKEIIEALSKNAYFV